MHTHNSCGARKHLESCPEHAFTPISRRMWGDELPSSCLRPPCATVQLTHVNTASGPRRWTPGGRRRRHVRGVSGSASSDERGCSAGVWTEASESVRPGCDGTDTTGAGCRVRLGNAPRLDSFISRSVSSIRVARFGRRGTVPATGVRTRARLSVRCLPSLGAGGNRNTTRVGRRRRSVGSEILPETKQLGSRRTPVRVCPGRFACSTSTTTVSTAM